MLFSIAATTLTLTLAAVPSSQVGLGETVVLPLAPTSVSADHLNVAMNDSGDLYVVWNSPQNPNPNLCAAEGVFLEYQATPTPHWILAGSSDVLGHPSADLFGHGSGGGAPDETCLKPAVVSVGEDFQVAWPRIDLAAPGQSRPGILETTLIHPLHDQLGGHTIRRPSGTQDQGFVFPGYAFEAGNSGETVSLTRRRFPLQVSGSPRTGAAVLVNIHQTNPPSGDFTNLYQLHGWEIDYPANGAPTISRLQDPTLGTGILLDGIRVDETVIDQIRGGRVPPFVIETKVGGASQLGGLLISHETFIHTFPRSPGEALGIGNVVVHWLQWDNASQPYDLHQVASKSFYSTPQVDRQRRSNLATYYSTNSNDHNYGFAWQTINLDRTDYQGHLAKISLNYQLLSLSFTDRNYPNPPPHQKKDARSLYGPNLDELLLVDASVLGAGTHPAFRIFWWDPVTTLETEIPPGCPSGGSPCAEFPRRPGYATQSGFDLAIVYDAQFGPNSPRRPFLHIVDL